MFCVTGLLRPQPDEELVASLKLAIHDILAKGVEPELTVNTTIVPSC